MNWVEFGRSSRWLHRHLPGGPEESYEKNLRIGSTGDEIRIELFKYTCIEIQIYTNQPSTRYQHFREIFRLHLQVEVNMILGLIILQLSLSLSKLLLFCCCSYRILAYRKTYVLNISHERLFPLRDLNQLQPKCVSNTILLK
jgi:hypothetical protein